MTGLTSGRHRTQTVTVGGLTFKADCWNDQGGTHSELVMSSKTGYVVQGTDFFTSSNNAGFSTPQGFATPGPGQISFASPTNRPSDFLLQQSGGVTGTVVIIQSGHAMTMTFAQFAVVNNCSVQAQIAPSS